MSRFCRNCQPFPLANCLDLVDIFPVSLFTGNRWDHLFSVHFLCLWKYKAKAYAKGLFHLSVFSAVYFVLLVFFLVLCLLFLNSSIIQLQVRL